MSFLNPLMLAGLGAISVPVIIHLLNRHRVRRVTWAAMRFLRASVARNQRRMNIEDWLLLALRCLLLALLALALARPTFQNTAAVSRGRTAVTGLILLDNSYSMGLTDGTQSRFDRARKYAETIIDSLPVTSKTAVWLAADSVRGLIPEPTRDLNLARKTFREAPLSDRGTRLCPAIKSGIEMLQRHGGPRREIYLLTDGQAGGWEELSETVKLLTATKRDIHLNLIIINDREDHNLGVSDLRLASGLTPVDQSLRFEVQVTNFGHDDARNVAVRLAVDEEPASDQTVIDSISAGNSQSVSLFTKLRTEGAHAVTAEITGDRLVADDRRTLAVTATRRLRVLLVDGHAGRTPLETDSFYLRNALAPVDPAGVGDFYLEPVTITPTELATTRLDSYSAVALANVPDLSQATAAALLQYIRRGGGLIVFPGDLVNVRFYNTELAGRYAFLPATFGSLTGAPDDDHAFHLQAKDYDHPLVTLWNDPAAGTLASARFTKAYQLQPAATPDVRVVIRFANGTPAIVERTVGQGRVILFASSANTAWNDLPVRPAFVPLLARSLGALLEQRNKASNIAVGDRFVYRVTDDALGKDAIITNAEKFRQFRRVEPVENQPVLSSEAIDLAGAYDVTVQTDPPLKLKFAAQADPRESRLDALSEGQLAQLGEIATIVHWQPDTPWLQSNPGAAAGWEIWRVLVYVALALAVVEMVVGQLFSEPK
jgi:Aerotolerance regulator N-terminal/von Willebrand factor type A domain/CARDB